jgi:hypothetical protein
MYIGTLQAIGEASFGRKNFEDIRPFHTRFDFVNLAKNPGNPSISLVGRLDLTAMALTSTRVVLCRLVLKNPKAGNHKNARQH